MAKRKIEMTGEDWAVLMRGEFPKKAKPTPWKNGRAAVVDTGMVAEAYYELSDPPPDDVANLAGVVQQSAIGAFKAIYEAFPPHLRDAALGVPCATASAIAGVLLDSAGQQSDALQKNANIGLQRSFDASPEFLKALRDFTPNQLAVMRDAVQMAVDLLELRDAVLAERWHYVAACAWDLGRLLERANNRQHERHVHDARIRKPQAMRDGLVGIGAMHSEDKKTDALALFDKLTAGGELIKVAESKVKKQYGISPRTLREWRRNR